MRMIFVCNIGSTSLKFHLFDMTTEDMLAKGYIERIGEVDSPVSYTLKGQHPVVSAMDTTLGYPVVIQSMTQMLVDAGLLKDLSEIDGIGFKAVHAGMITESSLVTDELLAVMEDYCDVMPAHNPPYINAMRQFKELLPNVSLVAAFETRFHKDMPDYAYIYPLPYEWYEKHQVRKFGFHGASHRYVSERAAEILGVPKNELDMITCHLGGSSSLAAIQNGVSIDTSMGFSTQAGTPMSARCGDIDPFIFPYIMRKENLSFEQVLV